MEYEIIDNPWNQLWIKRYIAQLNPENQRTRTVSDLTSRVRENRKKLLGTGISLAKLVTVDNEADNEAVVYLSSLLLKYALDFVLNYGPPADKERYEEYEDFFSAFFCFSLYMYTTDRIGDECIDDLIRLAQCYERNPEVYRIVAEDCLPDDVIEDMQEWIGYPGEHPKGPDGLEDYVMAAVSALVGAMREPECMME